MSTVAIGNIEINLVQWNKMGDHELVRENTFKEFEYEELANSGCGFIGNGQIVYPGDFLLEINGHVLSVLSPKKMSEVFNVEIET